MSTDTLPTRPFVRRSSYKGSPSWISRSLVAGLAWTPLVACPFVVLLAFPASGPRWVLMWALATAVYGGCKWLTWCRAPARGTPLWRHVAYLAAWPGMDAATFLDPCASPDRTPRLVDWLFASAKLGLGLALLLTAMALVPGRSTWLAAWIGLAGIAMTVHFGVFDILSLAWRAAGVNARPLMHWPLAATSLSEHWGERWNTAFRDLVFRFVFRPVVGFVGPQTALLVVFLVSGLVHELAISVPAAGGYGGPTLFFLVQAAGVYFERSRHGGRLGLRRGRQGWLFTMSLLLLPLPLLFPPPFLTNIVVPMLRAMGVPW